MLKNPAGAINCLILKSCGCKGDKDQCDHEPTLRYKPVEKLLCAFGSNIWIVFRYIYEGDDSALTVSKTDKFSLLDYKVEIESRWKSLGFRMKLIYPDVAGKDGFMTFCGYNFLVDEKGPRFGFIPEPARNIASSSWTTSALIRQCAQEGPLVKGVRSTPLDVRHTLHELKHLYSTHLLRISFCNSQKHTRDA